LAFSSRGIPSATTGTWLMSGICGSTNDSRRTRVAGMNAAMVARGPEGDATYTDFLSGVSLGARRLSIIDVRGGRQPMANEDLTVWAVLNGEIYNHPALREALRARGHRFTSGVDTEVLVHLYEEHGPAMVHLLEGMYAFAIWDSRREELLVVRDRLGEKPLFYAEQHRDLLFASELDALLAGMDREPELDAASVDAFFTFGYVPGPASIVHGVRQLPPGHVLRWERRARRVQVDPYWSSGTTPASSSDEPFDVLVAETARLLNRSVRSRLVADVPIGVLLSGGLDSTLVAALAASISEETIKTFTVGYHTGETTHAAQARATAQTLGTEHHELVLTEDQLLERVPTLLAGMDQPLADPSLVLQHSIAEHARREVTVAIGGEGADELFGGSSRYHWLWRSEPNRTTAQQPALRRRLYGPALRGAVEQARPATTRLMVLDQRHRLPDNTLVRADRAGMRVSLEVRTPYLNRELAEFAATVPEHVHLRGEGKALLRAVLTQLAPDAAVRTSKTTSAAPAADWLRGPLAPLVDRQLENGSAFAEGWLDRSEVSALFASHRTGARDAGGVIWPLLAFGLWLDRRRNRDVN
jgi:asparagine synthase (glutamine-hydrolysing)